MDLVVLGNIKEIEMDTGLRTSTNTAIAGVIAYVATLVAGMIPALAFLTDPQIQLGIVGIVGWLVARLSKTQANPGVL